MLRITLYKDCILNEDYEEVFSLGHKLIDGDEDEYSVLERYLMSLTKRVFDIPFAYYENSGQLVFEYEISSDNIYEYNYMKIEERDDEGSLNIRLVRYCFINKIEIKNEFVYLEYKEDIWSSYADKIKGTTKSYLSKSRFLDYLNINTDLHKIPIDYDGNDMLRVLVDENREITKITMYAQIQCKVLDRQGVPTEDFDTYIVRIKEIDIGQFDINIISPTDFKTSFTGNTNFLDYVSSYEYSKIVNYLTLNQSKIKCLLQSSQITEMEISSVNRTYEIGKIWCVPYEWEVEEDLENSEDYGFIVFNVDDCYPFEKHSLSDNSYCLIGKIVNYRRGAYNQFKSYNIENNFTNLMLGTLRTQVDFQNNGTDLNLELLGYVDNYNFTILMNIEGNIIDITDDFEINVPFTALNASETKQLEISRAIKNENIEYNKKREWIKFAKATNESGKQATSAIGSMQGGGNMISGIGKLVGAVVNQGIAIADVSAGIAHYNDQKIYNNMPVFSTTKSAFSVSSNILNGIYGLLIFRMTLDNEDFVLNFINKFGYIVYNFIDNFDDVGINNPPMFQNVDCNYNSIKFEVINLYGSFTREIAMTLNNILTNGVKIWYNESMSEDNYVV